MTLGTIGQPKLQIKEKRGTWYRLHPDQVKYPGAIMEMLKLPEDQYHWELWQAKGYTKRADDLMPDKKMVWEPNWGMVRFDIPAVQATQIEHKCDICGQICTGAFGLQAHKRKHDKEKGAEGGT